MSFPTIFLRQNFPVTAARDGWSSSRSAEGRLKNMEGMERRGDGKRETERLERGRSRTEDKIDYRREPGTRTYVEGARAQSGDKTDRNTSTIHRAWGGFLFEHPPPRSSALLIRLNVATDLTRRTRDSLISVAIISVMQRRGVAREIIFLLACVFSPFSFGFRFRSRGH